MQSVIQRIRRVRRQKKADTKRKWEEPFVSDNRRTTGQSGYSAQQRPAQASSAQRTQGHAQGTRPAARPAGNRPQTSTRRPAQASGAQRTQRPAQRPAQGGQRPPQGRPPVRRKKKKRVTGRFIGFIAVIALLIIGLCIAIPRIGRDDSTPAQSTNVAENAGQTQQEQSAQEQGEEETGTQTPTYNITTLDTSNLGVNESLNGTWRSILLLGTDARLWDDMKHTDTMIVVCYNTNNGAIRMISVMRDAFVELEGKGNVRINTVSTYAGIEGLIRTLNTNLGLNITEYMLVDFSGFRNVIDILGGIDVDITEVEMEYINSGLVEQINLLVAKGGRESALKECTLTTYGPDTHLNGLQALAYARIRKSDSDFKRTERQRTVIMEAANKAVESMTIVQMSQIASTMLQYVETNMPLSSLLQLGSQVLQNGLGDMDESRVPVNDSYVGESRGTTTQVWGMYDVDWEANKQAVQSLLNGY